MSISRFPFYVILAVSLLVALTLAYFNALHMDFIGDDWGRIVFTPAFKNSFATAMSRIMPDRPLLTFSLWLNYQWGGLDAVGYKFVNLALHGIVSGLMVLLMIDLNPTLKKKWAVALLLGLIFCVHPLNNQAVNSIIQRGVLLSALFTLWGLRLYIKETKTPIVFLVALLAMFSKSNAIAFPLLLLAYEKIYKKSSWSTALQKTNIYFLIWLLPLIFYFVVRANNQIDTLSGLNYFLLQWRVIFIYFKLFIWPTDLHFLYTLDTGHIVSDPLTWLFGVGHLAILGFIVYSIRRGWKPLAFSLAAMYLVLLPESSVFAIRHVAFEHRAYLPLLFFLSALSSVFVHWHLQSKKWFIALSLCLIVILGVANVMYNSKIRTHSQWIEYNISKNSKDMDFNLYNISILMEINPGRAEFLAQEIAALYPDNVIYQKYKDITAFPKMDNEQKKKVLQEMHHFLLQGQVRVYGTSRLVFIDFYGRSVQQFLSGPAYWEHIDDFLYYQIPDLRRYGSHAVPVFIVYRNNLQRLNAYYQTERAKEPWRALRVALALHENFAVNVSDLDKALAQWLETAGPRGAELFGEFKEGHSGPLPIEKGTID